MNATPCPPRELIYQDYIVSHMSIAKMQLKYGVGIKQIKSWLRNYDIKLKSQVELRRGKSKTHEKEILERYKRGESMCSLAKNLKICRETVKRVLTKYNSVKTDSDRRCRRIFFNELFFNKIKNEASAYLLGFLFADGNISKTKLLVNLALQRSDENHLIMLKNLVELDINNPQIRVVRYSRDPYLIKGNITKKTYGSRWTLSSKKMCLDLISLGCVPKKSLILKFPTSEQVPDHLINHFIRGYFDGDGSIYSHKYVGQSGPYRYDRKRWWLTICGTSDFLTEMVNRLVKLNVSVLHHYVKHKNITVFRIPGSAQNSIFCDFIYRNATVFLKRKHDKYLELKNDITDKNLCARIYD